MESNITAASARQRLSSVMPDTNIGKLSERQMQVLGADDAKQPISGLYGGELTLSVSRPQSSLMIVQESFDIACGDDTVLLAYSNSSGIWRRVLLWVSQPYRQVSGAFGDVYQTLLLRPVYANHPLLLVVHGTPWCTSTVSSFAMDVLKVGEPSSAMLLWHRAHEYRRADLDPPLTVKPTTNGFEVRASVSGTGDGDHISRKGVMRYAVTGNGVRRVEPLAINGRDSVVEWLALPRIEAAAFADGPAASLTWQMFQTFTYEGRHNSATIPYPTVGAVRACKDSTMHFQADVTSQVFDTSPQGSHPGPAYFVQLRKVSNGYRIHSVTQVRDTRCSGPNLMAGS
jgi:hypothetical protein